MTVTDSNSTGSSFGRVLVVDDDDDSRAYLRDALVAAGYEVRCAVDGAAAFELVCSDPPDLVLVDLAMPRMDGFTFLSRLRAQNEVAHVPVIVVSGHSDVPHRVAGLECGANDYVVKPVDAAELLARVRSHLRVSRMTEEWRCGHIVDPLTGLLNRRGCVTELTRCIARSLLDRSPLTVSFLDLDGFKAINDSFGHRVGDDVLWKFARIVESNVRRYDSAARWGGDEFVVVLPEADRRDAKSIVERIQRTVQRIDVRGMANLVGVSAGVASLHEDGLNHSNEVNALAAALIDHADRQMYASKVRSRSGAVPKRMRLARGSQRLIIVNANDDDT